MCGFIGVVGARVDLELGLPWLRRRGPDSQHSWSSADGRVSLLHCRLAIVDTDPRADQPFSDNDRGITVALNGEIYNYRQLRRELAGYPFRSQSDTEVIIAAYVLHGLDGFNRLSGMFSFVLVDERRRRVVLVRDSVGKKPLFVNRSGKCVFFGSSNLPLIACGGGADLDRHAATYYWARAYVSPDRTAFVQSRPVKPGQILELDWKGGETASQRCEPTPAMLYQGEGAIDVHNNIADLLAKAIDQRLENNAEPVTLLSGGIDSTIVTEVTRDRLRQSGRLKPLKVLTLGALIPCTQDEFFARYAARRLGLGLQIVSLGKGRLIDGILRALSVQDEPLGMPSYFFLHQMIEAAAQHGRILLTGDGGDEVFLGYKPPIEWCNSNLSISDVSPFVRVGPGPSEWMATWAQDVVGNTLLGHMFAKSDRASAEQGVEMRCPLLDHALMCYVRSLPFEIIGGNGQLKPLLKSQLSAWPSWFRNRRKLGFAYNLRWRWAATRFEGLRDIVKEEAIETFGELVSRELRRPARFWSAKSIMLHFGEAWRLLVWSSFLNRVSEATEVHGHR